MRRRGAVRVAAILGLVAGIASAQQLTIYHTNDTQGRLEPRPAGEAAVDSTRAVGGMARLVSYYAGARSRGEEPILLDGGDLLGASALAEHDAGRLVVELMTRAGLHAVVVGNHEFDYGLDSLRARAAAAGFAFLGANVEAGAGSPLRAWRWIRRGDLRVAVVGVVDPAQGRLINAQRNPGLTFTDPAAALQEVLPAVVDSADLIIGLAHLPLSDCIVLAGRFPEVSLWILGGDAGAVQHDVQLASGVHIVTAPGGGRYLGRIEVDVSPGSRPRGGQIRASLVPLTRQIPPETDAQAQIAEQRQDLERARGVALGQVAAPIADPVPWIAGIVRARTRAEVAVINRGAFRDLPLAGQVTGTDLDRLVRYEDDIVLIDLNGAALKKLAAAAGRAERAGQKLVFSGLAGDGGSIDGRGVNAEETYRVATTGFLAAGGDGYLGGVQPRPTPLTLGGVTADHLRRFGGTPPPTAVAGGPWGVWKQQTKISGSLSRTGISPTAQRYSGVSFLSGSDAMSWSSIVDSRWWRESGAGSLTFGLRSTFGQVRENGDFRESADRLQGETQFTWDRRSPAPFVSAEVNTVWTRPAGDRRPVTLRGSAGVQRLVGSDAKVRLGLGLERDLVAGRSEMGVEVVPEVRRRFGRGNTLSSVLKVFAGVTETRKISAQHYNNILVNLRGNLYVTVDANFFVHRDDEIGAAGLKSEVQIGIGYTLRNKWL